MDKLLSSNDLDDLCLVDTKKSFCGMKIFVDTNDVYLVAPVRSKYRVTSLKTFIEEYRLMVYASNDDIIRRQDFQPKNLLDE